MPSFMIVRLQISEIKQKQQIRPRAPAAQRDRKSNLHSAHAYLGHLDVLHAKFHKRATSNLGYYARTDRRTDNVIYIYIYIMLLFFFLNWKKSTKITIIGRAEF